MEDGLSRRVAADYLSSLRQKVGPALIPLVYSTVILRDKDGRILFHHRPDFNLWGLPGGILEAGESPAECARREAFEETGLRVEPVRLTAVLSGPAHNILYPNGDRVQQTTFYFESHIVGGSLQPRDESSRVQFFGADSPPKTLPWYLLALSVGGAEAPFFDPPDSAEGGVPEKAAGGTPPSRIPTWSFLRSRIGSAPLVLPGAAALVRNERGGILLVRRSDSGRWAFPGGLLELGENLAETVIRETEEETGLRIEPLRIRGVFGGHHVVFPGGDILYPVATLFESRIRSGQMRPDGQEIDRVEFCDIDSLPETVPGVRERLEKVCASPNAAVFQ
ncbi:MAG: NUDIX domain-containing protein [Anaerolineales bacterium]|nr:NUDIX domain-containing protein [Anaerolineales bacterium]